MPVLYALPPVLPDCKTLEFSVFALLGSKSEPGTPQTYLATLASHVLSQI